MKSENYDKIRRGLAIGICFTAYIFLIVSVLAAGLDLSFALAA